MLSLLSIGLIAAITWWLWRRTTADVRQRLARLEAALAAIERQVFQLSTRARGGSVDEGEGSTTPAPEAREEPREPGRGEAPAQPITPEPRPTIPAVAGSGGGWSHGALSAPDGGVPSRRPAGASLEERLGAHWAVYAGGLALALGGILLVRYSIEAGLIGPLVRVILGLLLAAGLVAAGEWLRRHDAVIADVGKAAPHIPSILTSAGTTVAFGTVYAAHGVYGFIGPALAFFLLGAVGIATMSAAAIHGPALAGLGLVGSYVTPLLVTSQNAQPWPLVVFLAVVAASALALARTRRWLWLAAAATCGAVLWGFVMMGEAATHLASTDWLHAGYAHALVQLVLAAAAIGIEPHLGGDDEAGEPDWIAAGVLAALTALIVVALSAYPLSDGWWMVLVVAGMVILAGTSAMSPPAAATAPLAGVIALAAMLAWPGLKEPAADSLMAPMMAHLLRLPENITRFVTFGELATVGVAAAAAFSLWRRRGLPAETAGLYALAATVTPLLGLVIAYLRVTQFDTSMPFAFAAVVLGLVFTLVAGRFQGIEGANPTLAQRLPAGAFAAAAIAGLSIALVASLERGYLTVAFALTALGTAYVAQRRDIPLLRYAVAALGLVVLGRLAWDPRIMGADVGTTPVLNWLLIGYGVPALCFAGAAHLLRRERSDLAVQLADGLAVLFAGLLAFFEVHHAMTGGNLSRPITGHVEQGLVALVSLGFTHVLTRLDLSRANLVFRYGSMVFAGISGIAIAAGLGLFENPYFTGERVSGPVPFSSLLLAYLLPGLAALYVARKARGVRPDAYVTAASVLGLLLVFGYVTLEVRHAFHGAVVVQWARTSGPERWATTVAWLALAVTLLGYGLWRGSIEARIASAVLVVVVSLKVVAIDLAGASGLWRALSFLCLGGVLIGIGLVYQRLIFARSGGQRPPEQRG